MYFCRITILTTALHTRFECLLSHSILYTHMPWHGFIFTQHHLKHQPFACIHVRFHWNAPPPTHKNTCSTQVQTLLANLASPISIASVTDFYTVCVCVMCAYGRGLKTWCGRKLLTDHAHPIPNACTASSNYSLRRTSHGPNLTDLTQTCKNTQKLLRLSLSLLLNFARVNIMHKKLKERESLVHPLVAFFNWQPRPGRPWAGTDPYQALPLLQFCLCLIFVRAKFKGRERDSLRTRYTKATVANEAKVLPNEDARCL